MTRQPSAQRCTRRAVACLPGAAALAVAACVTPAASAAPVDFAQLDHSANATTATLAAGLPGGTAERPATLVSASATRWRTGEAVAAGIVPRWAVVAGDPGWTVGAGLGLSTWRSRDAADPRRESGLALRLQSEWQGPVPGGRCYALAQVTSFRRAGFVTVQFSPAALPLGLELSHYAETGYRASTLGLRLQLAGSPWSLRTGATHSDGETKPFLGVGYNGF